MSNKAKTGILGVAIGAIAAAVAVGAVKYIDHEQKEMASRKKKQMSDAKLAYDPKQQNAISILSHHAKFMACTKDGNVKCHSKTRSNTETFISIPVPNNNANDTSTKVAFKTFDGKYVSVQKDGSITCKKENIGASELLMVHKLTNKKDGTEQWAFVSCHGFFLSAQWFGGKLIANRTEIDHWEKFIIQIVNWDDDDWE
eukprot:82014_1